jgi:hypothetical protein
MKSIFINLSNHPSSGWGREQLAAAQQIGVVKDLPFPAVDPEIDETEICRLAEDYYKKIEDLSRDFDKVTVLLEGEYTFTYALTSLLKSNGIDVISACSRREVIETMDSKGDYERMSKFRFIRFRKYQEGACKK